MDFPVSHPKCFSPLRFVRSLPGRLPVLPFALNQTVFIGGELIFESETAFSEGKFALRSEGGLLFFRATEGIRVDAEAFRFGDKIEVCLSEGLIFSQDPHIELRGRTTLRLLVRPARESKPALFDFAMAEKWQTFLRSVRGYFQDLGFVETQTPSLVFNPGMEPELEPFQTEFRHGREREKLFLPTSPELHLKQILSSGFTEIFEIKTCYRNEEVTLHHQPEFQMLEWYRAYANLDLIEQDLVCLVEKLAALPGLKVSRRSMAHLFRDELGFNLTVQTTRDELVVLARSRDLGVRDDETWNDVFHRLFVSAVEPELAKYGPLIVTHFPPSQAALARLTTEGWADRFELYWNGLEIANAFHELNDPVEQKRRFLADQNRRKEEGRTPLEIDFNFLRSLENEGLPPSAGIALGLDRLFMALYKIEDIRKTRFFSVEHQWEARAEK